MPVASTPAYSSPVNEAFEEGGGEPTSGGTWTHWAYSDPLDPPSWAPDDWAQTTSGNPHSPTHAFFCSDTELQKDDFLVTPSIVLGNVFAQMTFWHIYQFEPYFDGGVIEISTDGGGTWEDLAPHIIYGGYTGQIELYTGNNLAGREAWTSGYMDVMRQVVVDLDAYRGQAVNIRFRLGTDIGNGGTFLGWYIDDVVITTSTADTCVTCTPPSLPAITEIVDVSACAQSGIQVSYTAGSPATRHDLYKDGSLVVSSYASGATYNPGDTASHTYVVRAVNGADICSTDSMAQAGTDVNNTPGAPIITGITDEAICAQSGIRVSYTAGSGATSHNLVRDGSVVVTGYTSEALYNPGDTSSHSYVVRAVKSGCTHDSTGYAFADANNTPGAPVITGISDVATCVQSGIKVAYTAGSGALSHDLLKDGSLAVTGYTSGSAYDPGDTASHTYIVRAINGTCRTDSAGSAFSDVVCPVPGEVSPGTTKATGMNWSTKTTMNWQAASGTVDGYRLYRGTKAQLPNLVNSSTDSCTRYDGAALTFDLNGTNDSPTAGTFIWFLVDAYNGAGEGPAGNATAGARILNSTGACTP
jgi:hypothetical protein